MAVYIDSLKKQNSFLQSEIERYANAVDSLANDLALAQAQRDEVQKRLDEFQKGLDEVSAQLESAPLSLE